jgi:dCTP deaminase
MILSAQTIRQLQPITPFNERTKDFGMSYGLSAAGYDIRIAEGLFLAAGEFYLASSMEEFNMPNDVLAYVKDKSTWARRGLCVQNTVIEPGWKGFLTLELTNHNKFEAIPIRKGMPIAQIVFHRLDEPTEQPYDGKYQNQAAGAQLPIYER